MPDAIKMPKQNNNKDDNSASPPRFIVGIDLGTTNCAVAFVDTQAEPGDENSPHPAAKVETFSIPQWVASGQIESRDTLPSFHYQWTESETAGVDDRLPWQRPDDDTSACVGVMARESGMRRPGRRTASAKSWLSHDGVDRSADFLPWRGDADVDRLSPVTASAAYLSHIRSAWDHQRPDDRLADQDVVITLPASFDEVARALTIRAAKTAGLGRVFLIEEPQAAFYAWLDRQGDAWQTAVRPGQLILVCDIGGGTTDMTLIRVKPADADSRQVQFHRVAVGKHLILGGDNLDLAVAKLAERKLVQADSDRPLTADQWDRLVGIARQAKEHMLGESRPESFTLSLPAEGSQLVGGARQVRLGRDEIDATLLDGFFPQVPLSAAPRAGQSGFQEFGLPYAAEPAVTTHLAEFLSDHRHTGIDDDDSAAADRPDLVLFNGGVLQAPAIRDRLVKQLATWFRRDDQDDWLPERLASPRLDLAVARGAAYYGWVRRGHGVRIAANLGRSYYLQVAADPPQGMCLIPGSAQPGERFRASETPLELKTGTPVQFPLWSSSTRLADRPGDVIEIDSNSATPLPPICSALKVGRRSETATLSVVIEAELSEIGTVGLFCVDTNSSHRWRLDFDIRSTLQTDRDAHDARGEAAGIVDAATVEKCEDRIRAVFSPDGDEPPSKLVKRLQRQTGESRNQWPPTLLRQLWQVLWQQEPGRRRSPAHEARWLNLAGFALRPGYGVAVDDWRVAETWRAVHGKLGFASGQSKTEAVILWRRIAGGLTSGQQQQLIATMNAQVRGKAGRIDPLDLVESWRLIGALERTEVAQKIDLGRAAITQLTRPKYAKVRPALLWALGRLASRVPVYGPLNAVLPAAEVEDWIPHLIAVDSSDAATANTRRLALLQAARMTADRARDLSESVRNSVAATLAKDDITDAQLDLLRRPGQLDRNDQATIFGDALPLGIRVQRQ